MVELLWRVAYADGDLDKYEEHLVRRIADLIHVPHSVFIRMKHKAGGKRDGAAPGARPRHRPAAQTVARRTLGVDLEAAAGAHSLVKAMSP